MPHYNNTCLDITSQATPDPFITYARGTFYFTFVCLTILLLCGKNNTGGYRVPLWEADSITDFFEEGKFKKGPVWTPPPNTDYSAHLWAPELHALRGRWYVYVAAANQQHGNRSHRMCVLGGPPSSSDPHAGPWEHLGPIRNMSQQQWAIDGTVFEIYNHLYFAYSGWPLDRAEDDYDERTQQLFIIRMHDPITAASPPVMISAPDEPWERSGDAGINEGPQWLESQSSDTAPSWRGIVYSCAGSWTPEYKMATLRYLGGDPLQPTSWVKSPQPLLQNASHGNGPFGPGHGNFVHVGDETFAVFHATDGRGDGHGNRKCRMQRVVFGEYGPFMGGEVGDVTRDVARFSGSSPGGGEERGGGKGERLKGLLHSIARKI